MSGNCEILKCNALYGCVVVEHGYGIHYRARLHHLACITNIWPLSLCDSGHMLVTNMPAEAICHWNECHMHIMRNDINIDNIHNYLYLVVNYRK